MISNAVEGKPLPVYGEGKQVREWLHVDDHCAALWAAMTLGTPGESYNFGSGEETANSRSSSCSRMSSTTSFSVPAAPRAP